MSRTLIIALLLTVASVAAYADMRTVARAYEVGISDFRAPGTANGTLAMRPCPDCDFQTLRVSAATRYRINNTPVALGEFREALQQSRSDEKSIVIVKHDVDEDVVTAVSANFK